MLEDYDITLIEMAGYRAARAAEMSGYEHSYTVRWQGDIAVVKDETGTICFGGNTKDAFAKSFVDWCKREYPEAEPF